jgi:sugar/nucleoside kinase (ribokinase family)
VRTAAPILARLAGYADIVLVGLDEAATLWGARNADEVRELLPGPRTLIVKDGGVAAAAGSDSPGKNTAAYGTRRLLRTVSTTAAGTSSG